MSCILAQSCRSHGQKHLEQEISFPLETLLSSFVGSMECIWAIILKIVKNWIKHCRLLRIFYYNQTCGVNFLTS